MNKKEYKCEYCGTKMQQFDYELKKGYCGKCRELIDWKGILGDFKKN